MVAHPIATITVTSRSRQHVTFRITARNTRTLRHNISQLQHTNRPTPTQAILRTTHMLIRTFNIITLQISTSQRRLRLFTSPYTRLLLRLTRSQQSRQTRHNTANMSRARSGSFITSRILFRTCQLTILISRHSINRFSLDTFLALHHYHHIVPNIFVHQIHLHLTTTRNRRT